MPLMEQLVFQIRPVHRLLVRLRQVQLRLVLLPEQMIQQLQYQKDAAIQIVNMVSLNILTELVAVHRNLSIGL